MAALGACEGGRGARELRKASNDKNTTQHHNQVSASARAREAKGNVSCLTMESVQEL